MKPTPRFDWRHQYDAARDQVEGDLAAVHDFGEDLAQQQFRDSTDINVLAKRFGLDKQPLPVNAVDPSFYGDLSDLPDLRTALDRINEAKNRFMELDPKLRARFRNDPAELYDFIMDPDNADESVRLGLLVRPPDPQQQEPPQQEAPKETTA